MNWPNSQKIEWLRKTDDRGRDRVSEKQFMDDAWTILSALRGGHVGDRELSQDRRRYKLFREISGRLEGKARPVDDFFARIFRHTSWSYIADLDQRYHRELKHRLVIFPELTIKDNLSVRFQPQLLNEEGQWEDAPEWSNISYLGDTDYFNRPDNELLFIHDVDDLFSENVRSYRPTAEDYEFRNAACRAIHYMFWLEIERLKQRFDVQLGGYIAFHEASDELGLPVGLEIVNSLKEYREDISAYVKGFEQDAGISPQIFRDTCVKWSRNFDKASVELRQTANGLTPAVVRDKFALLEKAEDYGLWNPYIHPEAANSEEDDLTSTMKM